MFPPSLRHVNYSKYSENSLLLALCTLAYSSICHVHAICSLLYYCSVVKYNNMIAGNQTVCNLTQKCIIFQFIIQCLSLSRCSLHTFNALLMRSEYHHISKGWTIRVNVNDQVTDFLILFLQYHLIQCQN